MIIGFATALIGSLVPNIIFSESDIWIWSIHNWFYFIVILFIEMLIYRSILCKILFQQSFKHDLLYRIILLYFLISICWLPVIYIVMGYNDLGNLSLIEELHLNSSKTFLMLTLFILVLFLNGLSFYILSICCQRFRKISKIVYSLS